MHRLINIYSASKVLQHGQYVAIQKWLGIGFDLRRTNSSDREAFKAGADQVGDLEEQTLHCCLE
jgi:hypothetical protein